MKIIRSAGVESGHWCANSLEMNTRGLEKAISLFFARDDPQDPAGGKKNGFYQMKFQEEFRDAGIAKGLVEKIRRAAKFPMRIMEVCGTHTVSIFGPGSRAFCRTT